jgi:hypothetical protein
MKKLNDQFNDACKGSFKIVAFFERRMSPTLLKDGRGQWSRGGPPRILVTEESASRSGLPGQTEAIPSNYKDHRGLVKFANDRDGIYQITRDRLRKMVEDPAVLSITEPPQPGASQWSLLRHQTLTG